MSRRGWVLFAALCLIWGLPYLLIKVAVEELAPSTLVAVLLGVLVLDERFTVVTAVGFVLVLAGSVLATARTTVADPKNDDSPKTAGVPAASP